MSGATPQLGVEWIHAVEGGNRPLLSRLIAEGADENYVDFRGLSNLMIAAGNGDAETVTRLIESGASVYLLTEPIFHPRSALLEATRHGQKECRVSGFLR